MPTINPLVLRRADEIGVQFAASGRAKAGEEINLAIHAAHGWTPAADGSSGDQRKLAYRIVSAVLEH